MAAFQEYDTSLAQALRNARKKNKEGGTKWTYYGEPVNSYDSYFSSVLHGKRMVDLLAYKKEPVVVDLMAPSATIVDLFNHLPQPKKQGIALCYEDLRTDEEKTRDSRMNIQQIEGDISSSKSWKNLNKSLNGRKADLIMERALGGMACVPVHKDFYAYSLNRIWDMTSENDGVILLQMPGIDKLESVDVFVPEWVKTLNKNNIKAESYSLESVISRNLLDREPLLKGMPSCNALKIIKSPASPRILPSI